MSSGSFQKTSLDWQLRLLQQRVGEWLERVFARNDRPSQSAPQPWTLPEWFYQGIFWGVVIALAGWALWQIYRWLDPYLGRSIFGRGAIATPAARSAPVVPSSEWLARSRLAQQRGDYREACRALYLAALQKLSESQLIPDLPSRTDGEYLGLVRSLPRSAAYQTLIRTHEQLCFSDAPISAETCDRCQRAYRDLEAP